MLDFKDLPERAVTVLKNAVSDLNPDMRSAFRHLNVLRMKQRIFGDHDEKYIVYIAAMHEGKPDFEDAGRFAAIIDPLKSMRERNDILFPAACDYVALSTEKPLGHLLHSKSGQAVATVTTLILVTMMMKMLGDEGYQTLAVSNGLVEGMGVDTKLLTACADCPDYPECKDAQNTEPRKLAYQIGLSRLWYPIESKTKFGGGQYYVGRE